MVVSHCDRSMNWPSPVRCAVEQGGEHGNGAVQAGGRDRRRRCRRASAASRDIRSRTRSPRAAPAPVRRRRSRWSGPVAPYPESAIMMTSGLQRAQNLVAETHPVHDAGGEVLHTTSLVATERASRPRAPSGLLEVEREAALALVVLVEVAAAVEAGLDVGERGQQAGDAGARSRVSTRITSAPRWASCSVQNGPAHTQVKSATRMPASGARRLIARRPRRSGSRRRPRPRQDLVGVLPEPRGGTAKRPRCRREMVRRAGHRHGAASGWSHAAKKPRAFRCSGSSRSPIVDTGANGTRRLWPAWYSSSTVCSLHHSLQHQLERVPVGATREAVLEQLDAGPLRIAHELDERLPLVLFDAAEEDPAVAALEEVERLDRLLAEARGDQPQ